MQPSNPSPLPGALELLNESPPHIYLKERVHFTAYPEQYPNRPLARQQENGLRRRADFFSLLKFSEVGQQEELSTSRRNMVFQPLRFSSTDLMVPVAYSWLSWEVPSLPTVSGRTADAKRMRGFQSKISRSHEIAVYGTLRRWAEIIGRSSDASILESIQAEEEKADELLTQIAGTVNMQASRMNYSHSLVLFRRRE
jgi:hypothetical protein